MENPRKLVKEGMYSVHNQDDRLSRYEAKRSFMVNLGENRVRMLSIPYQPDMKIRTM